MQFVFPFKNPKTIEKHIRDDITNIVYCFAYTIHQAIDNQANFSLNYPTIDFSNEKANESNDEKAKSGKKSVVACLLGVHATNLLGRKT